MQKAQTKPDNQQILLEESIDKHNTSQVNRTCIYNHQLHETDDEGSSTKLYIACGVAFVFLLTEVVMGLISGSLAILSDAAHMFSDIFGFAISIFAIKIAKKKASKKFSFGYQRAEIIGALGSIVLIWALTILLLYQATTRIIRFDYVKNPLIMLITAGLALFFNLVLAKVLHGHSGIMAHTHNHDHGGHDHGHEDEKKKEHHESNDKKDIEQGKDHSHDHKEKDHSHDHKEKDHKGGDGHGHHDHDHDHANLNLQAAMIHVIGDIIQSIGVLIAAAFIYAFGTTDCWNPWHLFDPICTYIFCFLVMMTTKTISWKCINILMEGTPLDFKIKEFQIELEQVKNMEKLHNVHVWNISDKNIAMVAHVKGEKQYHKQILEDMEKISRKFEINRVTIQIEEKNLKIKQQ